MRLKDKVAIISAGGSGLGRAGALTFAREGAKVVVGDIDPERGNETVRMIKTKGGEAAFVQIDAGKVGDMRRLIDTTVDVYGKLNVLWNNAGIAGPGPLEDTEEADFERCFNINVKGAFFASKFAAPHMKKAGSGSIIFTSSITGLRGSPASPAYSLTKGALVPLAMTLAVYLGAYNIRANCICPGFINTPMLRNFVDRTGTKGEEYINNAIQDLGKKSIVGRPATPEEVANTALFLASDEAWFVNGAILPVDGGLIARL